MERGRVVGSPLSSKFVDSTIIISLKVAQNIWNFSEEQPPLFCFLILLSLYRYLLHLFLFLHFNMFWVMFYFDTVINIKKLSTSFISWIVKYLNWRKSYLKKINFLAFTKTFSSFFQDHKVLSTSSVQYNDFVIATV